MFKAILNITELNSDIDSGTKVLLVQLGNIAYRVGRSLDIDGKNGHINDQDAEILGGNMKKDEMKI